MMADRGGSMMVYAVAAWHGGWGLMILVSPAALGPTPLATLWRQVPAREPLAFFLIVASFMAIAGLRRLHGVHSLALMLPQQLLLVSTGISILRAVAMGSYADGVQRASLFILADQWPALVMVVFHTIAISVLHGSRT